MWRSEFALLLSLSLCSLLMDGWMHACIVISPERLEKFRLEASGWTEGSGEDFLEFDFSLSPPISLRGTDRPDLSNAQNLILLQLSDDEIPPFLFHTS